MFTRDILRETDRRREHLFAHWRDDRRAKLQTREQLLAWDLAEGLEDPRSLRHYLAYAHRYPEALLRRCLSEARAVPEREIKRSRGALFEHLLKRYARRREEGSGD